MRKRTENQLQDLMATLYNLHDRLKDNGEKRAAELAWAVADDLDMIFCFDMLDAGEFTKENSENPWSPMIHFEV